MRSSISLAVAILLVAAPAYAASVDPSPFLAYLNPVITTVISSLVTAALGFGVVILKRYLTKIGINVTDDQWAVVTRTASHWAAQWWAKEDASLALQKITVGDPRVATYANLAITEIPQIASALGLTPEKMQQFIVAEIGKLQAKATAVTVPAVTTNSPKTA